MERTLWFAETYGLTLNKARFTDQNGVNHGISFSGDKEKKKFNDLLKEEQDKVKEILFIQDKFSIGDAAYHELTMTSVREGLPRTNVMRQCKDALNDLCHIERTPGKAEGPLVNFRDELCSTIQKHVSTTGNHTVAIIKRKESYELLQTSCATLFADVNRIVKEGVIDVDGKEVPVEMYLGGDHKVPEPLADYQ